MKAPSNDWDQDERDALLPLEDELEALRRRHANDPSLDLLRAASADALPAELQESTAAHLAGSRWSRVLVEGANTGSGELSPDDETRLLDRIRRDAPAGGGRRRLVQPLVWASVLGAAAMVVVAVVIVKRSGEAPAPSTPRAATESPATASPPAVKSYQVPLAKPDVKLSPRAFTYRGTGDSRDFVSALKPALDAYRQNDYARADREFTALATKYPEAVEVAFYQGVARLFLNDLAGADASLSNADRLADASFAPDVSWYRAIVDERLGRIAEARARLTALCGQGNHGRQSAACEAAGRLR